MTIFVSKWPAGKTNLSTALLLPMYSASVTTIYSIVFVIWLTLHPIAIIFRADAYFRLESGISYEIQFFIEIVSILTQIGFAVSSAAHLISHLFKHIQFARIFKQSFFKLTTPSSRKPTDCWQNMENPMKENLISTSARLFAFPI